MPESRWRNFLTRTGLVQHWTDFCGRLTQLQGLQTRNPSAAENVRSVQETCKCLCKWWPLWAQTVTGGIAYELVRRLFHIGNFCFWAPFFKQLLPKNCAVDFVEICNVCARKVIIKAAKRIFNSDKICCSYYDFYFGVTFFGTHCIYIYNGYITTRLEQILWYPTLSHHFHKIPGIPYTLTYKPSRIQADLIPTYENAALYSDLRVSQ